MATLGLVHGRRNSSTGRIERLSGRFSSTVPGKRYTEVFVTDCKKTIKINGRIFPGANQVFSFIGPELADANSQLDLSGDLFVYVRAKGQTDDYSNAYELDKDEGHSDAGSLKQLKARKIQECRARLAEINRTIGILNGIAVLANDTLSQELAAEIDNLVTDKMAELASQREQLEEDLRKKQDYYDKMFGRPKKSSKKKTKKAKKKKKEIIK